MGWLFRILSLKVSSRKMERLSAYKIEGDVYELENIINSDARIFTTLRDIVSVLAKDKTNCIMVGYGESLTDAYNDASVEGRICRLVHIFYSDWSYADISKLNEFIGGIGKDIIFGCSMDEKLERGIKMVMLCQ